MHIRDLVKQRWADEGFYASKDTKIQAFLKYIDDNPLECLDGYIKEFRKNYYDLFEKLVSPLMKTRDKLLRIIIIRNADLKKPKELKLLKEFVKRANPREDEQELLCVAKLGHKELTAVIRKHKDLTDDLRRVLKPPTLTARKAKNIVVPKQKKVKAKSKKPK